LQGTSSFELDAANDTNDLIRGLSNVIYGGTLNLSFAAGTLVPGDRFKLFDAATYSGAFANVTPGNPGQWLAWDTSRLGIDGTLGVVSDLPRFEAIVFGSGVVVFSGTHGPPGGPYSLLSSTNIELPVPFWTVTDTNYFDLSGNFILTQAVDPSVLQKFFLIRF
jgi:hypothetical protein